MLGLPGGVRGCLFDLDGVLTDTATVHAAAWREMFDAFLRARAQERGEPFTPFDPVADYDRFVDGRPRLEGTRSVLAGRGIALPDGEPGDPPGTATVHGLSNAKNEIVLRRVRADGVRAYPGSVAYVTAARRTGLACAVVTASANAADVLTAAGLDGLFGARVDGVTAAREHLRGKPAPDPFLAGARALSLPPRQAAVFEDALAGVQAGRAGGFGCVVGVDRTGRADDLRAAGADVVVADLQELLAR